jgi:hypothetical protein
MSDQLEFRCPKCGHELTELLSKIKSMERNAALLRKFLKKAEQELEHLGHSRFVASYRKKHFHKPTCIWATYLLGSSNFREFASHREAERAGYKPCKTCRA